MRLTVLCKTSGPHLLPSKEILDPSRVRYIADDIIDHGVRVQTRREISCEPATVTAGDKNV